VTAAPGSVIRIGLARSLPRLLAVPAAMLLAAGGAIVAGVLVAPAPAAYALAGLGGIVAIGAGAAAVLLLSIRLEVAESAVALTWLGGRREYALIPGPVTRVQLRGPRASALRPRSGALGWGIGRARLRDEEEIELVRLAATPSAILIPTDRGRLAVAPAREEELLEALATAAHARQRSEAEQQRQLDETATEAATASAAPVDDALDIDVEPSALTGIERALLEERLARERAAAERDAEAARAVAATAAAGTAGDVAGEPAASAATSSRRARPTLRLARLHPGWAFVLMPTLAAAVVWWIGRLNGGYPEPGTDLARLTSLALVLAGPATSVGAVMALAWWPRIVGVVVAGGLAATIFIGRSLIG
jgi:hypothetical protein